MDEVLAVMPAIEKQLLEAELSQSSQRRESTSLSSSMSGAGFSHSWMNAGNTSINDLSMSWEQIPLPAPRHASYNPLKTPAPKRAKAPLFGGVVPSRPVSEASASTSRNLFPPVATNQPPPQPLAISVSTMDSSIPAPSLVDSTQLTSTNGFHVSQKPAPEPVSFQLKASANQRPNAFYNPAQPSDGNAPGVNGGEISGYSRSPSLPLQRSLDDSARDIQMMLDDEGDRTAEEEPTQITNLTQPEVEETSAPFSFSVFGTSSNGFANTSRSERPSMVQSQTTSSRLPPGAFAVESDEEPELEPPPQNGDAFSVSTSRQRQPQKSASPPPRRKSTTRIQTSANKKTTPELEKTIPGSLFYGETEGEDEDDVAPLPPTTPARRTQRKARTPAKAQKQGLVQEEKVMRRSSRLSTASSRGSPSPEPLSPQKAKTRRSTRVPTTSATGTRTSTRKKRS
ncbi:hypothetical protein BDM02DRAFT_1564456 [Thelephora ganbajun]|uniref:Uncharacterized protein n=1 Tax=Thelephora ganbajun TaxID=370292 RepID=A0ACB6ZVS1_THEGA|nr:hypothetical protein BDM02DRAFT_1564456 [Thelephora ganbajun]